MKDRDQASFLVKQGEGRRVGLGHLWVEIDRHLPSFIQAFGIKWALDFDIACLWFNGKRQERAWELGLTGTGRYCYFPGLVSPKL